MAGDRPDNPYSPIPMGTWNAMVDMLYWWKRTYGTGNLRTFDPKDNPTAIIRLSNETADSLNKGDILELDTNQLATIDAEWPPAFKGKKPTGASIQFGILLDGMPAKAGSNVWMVRCQMAGLCIATINVQATWHRRAYPVKDAYQFKSGLFGPVEILSAPASTGNQACLVSVGHASNRGVFAKTTTSIAAASLSSGRVVLGSGTAKVHSPYANAVANYEDSTHEVTVYNMGGAAIRSGKYVHLVPTEDWLPMVDIESCTALS